MALPNGDGILLMADVSGVQTIIGSQRDFSQEESNATVDTSSKTSGRQGTFLSGRYTSRLTAEAIYVPSDAAMTALKDAGRAGTIIKVQRQEDGSAVESVDAFIERYQIQARDQEAALVNIDLLCSGAWGAPV